MDPTVEQLIKQIETLLKPEVLAALIAAPFLIQWAKVLVPGMGRRSAAIVSFAVSAALILTQAWGACDWRCMVLQVLLGWVFVDQMYVRVVEPMARSANPLVPPTP